MPLRTIFEELGAIVGWGNNIVTAKKGNITVSIEIGSNKLYVNGKAVRLDAPAEIINSRTFVPLRAVSEAFNNTVEWNGSKKIITIK